LTKLQLDGNKSDLATAVGAAIALRNDRVILISLVSIILVIFDLDTNYTITQGKSTSRSSNTTNS